MTSAGFEDFVRARGRDLWRAAWLLTGDVHKAEDLLQTALAKSYRHYKGNEKTFESYVRTTMYRTFCSWWQRKWRGEIPSSEHHEIASVDESVEVSLDLARALAELPRNHRAVLVLRYYEDRTIHEVSETLGLAEGTVKAYSHKALLALRASRYLIEEEV
ncbi:SigE family RNA polymerase sigma factor [Tessaracoccus flavescens]|uniref:Uncharacterized protein n=1 Tax=Tessaracoccus flavescens TaxID=399497 RepID=A0A1Q2D0T1_9ACTN|nr:SigE family RNA polymerase sigma factor [Tessaracoccus flavescens]AQP51871.1 hypothetical protein BW733_14590 [Tessaracoccus flavescens]